MDFQHLQQHRTDFPRRSFLGTAADAAALPAEHQDQIHFLDIEATQFAEHYLHVSYMQQGAMSTAHPFPFRAGYFQQVENHSYRSLEGLKKWLYQRAIPFSHYGLLIRDDSGQAVWLTWKMVIKYAGQLFRHTGRLMFDETLNWGLFYDHHGLFTFGRNRIFNPEEEYQQMYEQNELRQQYPFLRFPY